MRQIQNITKGQLKKDIPELKSGDTVQVYYKVQEAGKERNQIFQGIVIRKKGKGSTRTFTVRKVSFGVGVEKTFPLNSPRITKIKVISKGKTRRGKLYYLREKVGKEARIKEKK